MKGMLMRITTRHARYDDIDCLSELIEKLFGIEKDFIVDHEKQRKALNMLLGDRSRSVVLVAVDGSRIVGMVTGQLVISTASGGYSVLLEDMIVHEDFRKRNVGSMLLKNLMAWGRTNGAMRIHLVADDNNAMAHPFYEKNGFRKSSMRAFYSEIG